MFKEGELIIYSGTGVCRVMEIVEKELEAGTKRLFYILQPLYQRCVISAPANSDKVFMRPIISRAEAERLIEDIPSTKTEIYHNRALHQLADYYEKKLKSHDCGGLLQLMMSLYAKKKLVESQNKKFSTVDERFLKRTEELLFGEFAAALGIDRDEIQSDLREKMQACI
ncbi:MAG: hypothetical protein HUJ65_07710 [Oscillospiraceae bacterium]|nr:hypothetical protein [Oscillospiraceae bacterium]